MKEPGSNSSRETSSALEHERHHDHEFDEVDHADQGCVEDRERDGQAAPDPVFLGGESQHGDHQHQEGGCQEEGGCEKEDPVPGRCEHTEECGDLGDAVVCGEAEREDARPEPDLSCELSSRPHAKSSRCGGDGQGFIGSYRRRGLSPTRFRMLQAVFPVPPPM